MILYTTASYGDSLKLTFRDIFKLLIGKVLTREYTALKVGLWRAPHTGCPCKTCSDRFGPKPTGIKWIDNYCRRKRFRKKR